jgi:hypothetical protein
MILVSYKYIPFVDYGNTNRSNAFITYGSSTFNGRPAIEVKYQVAFQSFLRPKQQFCWYGITSVPWT